MSLSSLLVLKPERFGADPSYLPLSRAPFLCTITYISGVMFAFAEGKLKDSVNQQEERIVKRRWLIACAFVLVSIASLSQATRLPAAESCDGLSGTAKHCCLCDQTGLCEYCCSCNTGLPLTACVPRCE